ncbi:MAG: DUF3347 domain-containing protein [Siphonobacter sp.]
MDLALHQPELIQAIASMLESYWEIKKNLAQNNGVATQKAGQALLMQLERVERTRFRVLQGLFFQQVYRELQFDVEHISETQLANHQREHFGDVSQNMAHLLKAFQFNHDKVYHDVCPGSSQHWLSLLPNDQANPFSGPKQSACSPVSVVEAAK